ncbi:MAG: helix-turn-helix domain-containing protein [Betaproteobacteria bacterium]|jgi:predicted XRE-type DNA-binding protein|uniref:Predicted transcriptional regulators n=1 Tax=Serpentinimonas maccroryi TaxID=1458426 RepID=A0A060NRR8_9BURK|nr:XRE family transcriptional regulator [Serpentinimonas maccroryi]MBA4253121.1 transcriptional regulator [Comamonadaceae bacterium]MCL5969804.1 helix-turn-helix domain-containing protein [Betaproteobacteria bacterium]MCM2479802.1 XRE family transcriptional regulator [Serpentinimonas maccroryi]MCM2479805.1 XRE family transcriptional regulator [Serpentinimonas maccroryi]BAO84055.1 predicted transcriptional regulators [Serpentinimonas maccroryi]
MANKFADLRAQMTSEARARVQAKAQAMLAEMPLNELRQARGLSQKMLAEVLHVQQPAVAKIEKRTDMYISTLRSHIEAMGGELEVVARFPDGAVKISNFADLGKVTAV